MHLRLAARHPCCMPSQLQTGPAAHGQQAGPHPALALVSMNMTFSSRALASPSSIDTCRCSSACAAQHVQLSMCGSACAAQRVQFSMP